MKNLNKQRIGKLVVDRKLCIGAAPCVVVAPLAFKLDHKNIAVVKKSFSKHTDNELIIAAQSCPVAAITLYDKLGNKIFP